LACGALAVPAFAYASRHARTISVPSGRGPVFRSSTTRCSSGQHVLFGGFKNGVAGMRRTTNDRWTVDGFNLGGPALKLTSYAYCGYGPVATKATKTVRIRSVASATAQCPSGKVVLAAGFAAPRNTVLAVTRIQRTAVNRLTVSAYLRYGITKSATLTAIAYCGAGPAPIPVAKQVSLTKDGGHSRATCPSGRTLTFGGAIATRAGSQPPLIFAMQAVNQNAWDVANSTSGRLTAIAYCR
jgi:hypothetical protein